MNLKLFSPERFKLHAFCTLALICVPFNAANVQSEGARDFAFTIEISTNAQQPGSYKHDSAEKFLHDIEQEIRISWNDSGDMHVARADGHSSTLTELKPGLWVNESRTTQLSTVQKFADAESVVTQRGGYGNKGDFLVPHVGHFVADRGANIQSLRHTYAGARTLRSRPGLRGIRKYSLASLRWSPRRR